MTMDEKLAQVRLPDEDALTAFWRWHLPAIHAKAKLAADLTDRELRRVMKALQKPLQDDESLIGAICARKKLFVGRVTLLVTTRRIYLNVAEPATYPVFVIPYGDLASAVTEPMHTNPGKSVLSIRLKSGETLRVSDPSNAYSDTIDFINLADALNELTLEING